MGSINATQVVTAVYPNCSGLALKSANLNFGSDSPIIPGSGNDLWYKFTAQYNTFRASLSAALGDNEIRLYQVGNGCLQWIETEHESYVSTTGATGNQILITDDLVPGQMYYVAVHNISGTMNPSAKICFNHFTGSSCDHYYTNNTGIYPNVCTSFKAQYKGNASNYIFHVLSGEEDNQDLNITPWTYETGTANSVIPRVGNVCPANMSNLPRTYTIEVPVVYSVPDAANNYVSILANATNTCTVTMNPESSVTLRPSDRCPITKSISASISINRSVCGAKRYEWEFTQQLPNPQPPITVLGGMNTSVFFINNIPGVASGKTYNVRIRPIHANGQIGNWGIAHCMKVGNAGMILEPSSIPNEFALPDLGTNQFSVFPNPTNGGHFTLAYNGEETEELRTLTMTDITGKMILKTQVVIQGNSVDIDYGQLASGVYMVMIGEERLRLVVGE
jgi:hypothetical protein